MKRTVPIMVLLAALTALAAKQPYRPDKLTDIVTKDMSVRPSLPAGPVPAPIVKKSFHPIGLKA